MAEAICGSGRCSNQIEGRDRMRNCLRIIRSGMVALLVGLVCAGTLGALQREDLQSRDQVPENSSQAPALRIPVDGLGFLPPGDLYALMRLSYATLDFLDPEHLLFTFHHTELLPRLVDSAPDDDDQMIHAVVLQIPGGKVVAQANWRMRDRARYLWPLGDGQFLVRMRNQLHLVDKSLTLQPYLNFPGNIKSIQVGLGGHFLLAECEEERVNLNTTTLPGTQDQNQNQAQGPNPDPNRSQLNGSDPESYGQGYVLRIIRTDIKKQVAMAHTRVLPYVPLTRDGYVYALRGKGDHWLVGVQNLQSGARSNIGEIESACMPLVHPLNDQTMMAITCAGSSSDHVAVGFDLKGKRLWAHRWSGRRIWPSFAVSRDGNRFVYETLLMDHEVSTISAADPESVMGQIVEVFDSVTGQVRLTATANPILDAGQNFALSADGRRFAVLHNNAIEIFDLPPAGSSSGLESSRAK